MSKSYVKKDINLLKLMLQVKQLVYHLSSFQQAVDAIYLLLLMPETNMNVLTVQALITKLSLLLV